MRPSLHIDATGMCCAVGVNTAQASAAMRAGMDHFRQTEFWDFADKPIVGAMLEGLPLGDLVRRVSRMFELAVEECLAGVTPVPRVPKAARAARAPQAVEGLGLPRAPESPEQKDERWKDIPLLLLTAEEGRPGMPDNWAQDVFAACTEGREFHPASRICPWGKAGLGLALPYARELLEGGGLDEGNGSGAGSGNGGSAGHGSGSANDRASAGRGRVKQVLVVGVDTYFSFASLVHYLQERRVITGYNSDGFHPGEGAGAVLLSLGKDVGQGAGKADAKSGGEDGGVALAGQGGLRRLGSQAALSGRGGVYITGVGHGEEMGHRTQDALPNRADGMTRALRMATAQCGHKLTETHFHYSDCSGEAFFAKECTHALMRCFEHTVPEYPHLMVGSTLGETGAAVGPLLLALCTQILGREDGIGSRVLLHFSADSGQCAAVIAEWR